MKGKIKGSDKMHTPKNSRVNGSKSSNQRYKNLSWKYQFKLLDNEFNTGYFTMKTVSIKLEIDRANICRYISKRRKQNKIYLVKYGICPITKTKGVGFYTTNYDLYLQFKTLSNGK
jgi:hypothetical protein